MKIVNNNHIPFVSKTSTSVIVRGITVTEFVNTIISQMNKSIVECFNVVGVPR